EALNETLASEPVSDKIRDRRDLELVLRREALEVRHQRDRAVVFEHLADDAARRETGDAREVNGRLDARRAHENTAVAGLHGKDVTRDGEIAAARLFGDSGAKRARAACGGSGRSAVGAKRDRGAERAHDLRTALL